jgi:tetratricopeptide (TPR) repeat protein
MENESLPSEIQTTKVSNVAMSEEEIKEISPKKEQDPESLFEQGQNLLKSDQTEQAIEFFSKALEVATQTRGDLHESLYKFYFAYADALIVQCEKENSNNMFGDAVPNEVPQSEQSGSSSGEEGEDEGEGEGEKEDDEVAGDRIKNESIENRESRNEGTRKESQDDDEEENSQESGSESEESEAPQNPPPQNNQEEDLQLAFENLDTSRLILSRLPTADTEFMYKVQLRLGDLESLRENFEGACQEYMNALTIIKGIEGLKPSREQATVHYLIGLNFLYSKDKESEAAEHFKLSYNILESVLLTTDNEKTIAELKSIMEDLSIKIEDALEQKESVKALKEMENTDANAFDAPMMTDVVDLGVVKRKKQDDGLETDNDYKKTIG